MDPRRIFIIDIDGTVCQNVSNEEGKAKMLDARPCEESIRMVTTHYDEGNYISFISARTHEHREATESWLARHGVKYHQLILNKPRKVPPFSEYHFIDDAKVRATTFKGRFTPFVRKTVEIDAFEE